MTSVGPTSQLISIIREQLNSAQSLRFSKRTHTTNNMPRSTQSAQGLFEMTAKRIRTIDRDDPFRKRKAFKFFLESVLLGELGEEMINDPAFYQLVEQVQRTMESDDVLSAQIEEAGEVLLQLHRST
jgi:hypothetical protein